MSIKKLPHGIVKLISSTQVIDSVSSVIKELVENSIDAGATVVDIKLERYGLDKIEVRDNGVGINSSDIHSVCKPNHTSKIHTLEDLGALESYGFRGEALNSICAVSRVSITTKTEQDEVASVFMFDNNGTIRETQQSHQMRGTTITITNLFKNVPVRRQYYDNVRKASEELKKIEKVVKILSVIHPRLRVTISHNKCLIWHKTAVNTLKQSLMQMYQHVVLKNLEYFSHTIDDFSLEMLICKRDCNWSVLLQPLNEAILFFINHRPIKDKKVEQVIVEEMNYLFQSALPSNKCPLTLISLKLPPRELDVNLEPNKTKVFIQNHEDVLKQIRECVTLHFYKQSLKEIEPEVKQIDFQVEENPPKRPKLTKSCKLDAEKHNDSIRNSCTEDTSCKDNQIVSVSMKGDENSDAVQPVTNDLIDGFENCDLSVIEHLIEQVESSVPTENFNSGSHSSISENLVLASAIIDRESSLLDECVQQSSVKTSENAVQQNAHDTSQSTVIPDSMIEQSDIDSASLESSTKHTSCVKHRTENGFLSSNQKSETTYNPLKYMNKSEQEISPDPRNRLSISGNLVDDLFQSQIADDEEIILRSTQNSVTNKSVPLEPSFWSAAAQHDDISPGERSNLDLFAREGISVSSLENELRPDISSFEGTSSKLNDDGCSNANSTSLTQTTLSQWSRGHAVVNNQPLKGPCAVLPNKNSRSEKQLNKESLSPLERSVSSQMGRKDMAGLTNFARSARLEVIENNPGMSFTRVASELAKRWRGLDESQKNEYAERAKTRKNHQLTPKTDVSKSKYLIQKQKLVCNTSTDTIKTGLLQFKNKQENCIRIIGALESESMYLCRIGQEIMVVDVQNLQRNVIHDRYIRYSNMSSRCLTTPLELTEKLIGNKYWTLLLSMDKSRNGDESCSISDPRILKNGFRVLLEETLGEVEMWLTGVAEQLQGDSVEELMKTLQLASLSEDVRWCRSEQIQQILRIKADEAFRDTNIGGDEVETLLEYWLRHMVTEKCTAPSDRVSMKLFTL